MPKHAQSDPPNNFVPRYLPWLLGGVMLALYGATVNHWVTLQNLNQVAMASGWVWRPQIFNPLTLLATLPFRWLPAAHVPLALNIFSAGCGAATLAVLARSVAILPQDRTELARNRERSDFSFLTGWGAWVPPLAAVVFAGCQLTFWENATTFSGESFELLWFAIILWQLLEYRLDEREERMLLAAFLYGAGVIENWAMVGFIPVFLMMIIWLRGADFFNLNFLWRMTICGLAGVLLLLLVVVPLAARFSGAAPLDIWFAIKSHLHSNLDVVKLLKLQEVRRDLALLSLTSLLPALLMAIRWSSSFGDSSRLGATLVHYLMHVVNAIILGTLVWVTLDPPFSPRKVLEASGSSAPALSFSYIGALCIGYYSGYFMLIFGKSPVPTKRNPRPEPAVPKPLLWLCPVVLACLAACLVSAAGLLIYKNAPVVRTINNDSLRKFARITAEKLPSDRAVALCDSDDPNQNMPLRSYLLQAELACEGRAQLIPVVDTHDLELPSYHTYLHKRFPKIWPLILTTNETTSVSPRRIIELLDQLSKSNQLCYLNPSFGYFFERFYQVPHGLVYALKPLPADQILPPTLDKEVIAENETFWKHTLESVRPAIEQALHPTDLRHHAGVIGRIMQKLHVSPETNSNALLAGQFYSHSLDYLGVQIQRSEQDTAGLDQAAALFRDASELSSTNVVASVNLAFNRGKTLRVGTPDTLNLSRVTTDQFGRYHNWNEVLSADGPYDETSFCYDNGRWFMRGGLLKQAATEFNRVRQLAPHCLEARLDLAQIYVLARQPDHALEVLQDPLTHGFLFDLTKFNSTPVNVLAASAHFQKQENAAAAALLESEMNIHPDDEMLLLISAQVFNRAGLYTNALDAINRKLARTPNDPVWLYGKGKVSLMVGAYAEAAEAFSRFLELDTNHPAALLNRGIAYYLSDRIEAAQADFRQLQAAYTNSFQAAYGLGEIAWRKHQTNDAIRNYHLYLANVPTNTAYAAEVKSVRERLSQLDPR